MGSVNYAIICEILRKCILRVFKGQLVIIMLGLILLFFSLVSVQAVKVHVTNNSKSLFPGATLGITIERDENDSGLGCVKIEHDSQLIETILVNISDYPVLTYPLDAFWNGGMWPVSLTMTVPESSKPGLYSACFHKTSSTCDKSTSSYYRDCAIFPVRSEDINVALQKATLPVKLPPPQFVRPPPPPDHLCDGSSEVLFDCSEETSINKRADRRGGVLVIVNTHTWHAYNLRFDNKCDASFYKPHPNLASECETPSAHWHEYTSSSQYRAVHTSRPRSITGVHDLLWIKDIDDYPADWEYEYPRPYSLHNHLNNAELSAQWFLKHVVGLYNYDIASDADVHFGGTTLLLQYDAVYLHVHPEYVTRRELIALQTYVEFGGSLLYFGGNFAWRPVDVDVRSLDGHGYRLIKYYKDYLAYGWTPANIVGMEYSKLLFTKSSDLFVLNATSRLLDSVAVGDLIGPPSIASWEVDTFVEGALPNSSQIHQVARGSESVPAAVLEAKVGDGTVIAAGSIAIQNTLLIKCHGNIDDERCNVFIDFMRRSLTFGVMDGCSKLGKNCVETLFFMGDNGPLPSKASTLENTKKTTFLSIGDGYNISMFARPEPDPFLNVYYKEYPSVVRHVTPVFTITFTVVIILGLLSVH